MNGNWDFKTLDALVLGLILLILGLGVCKLIELIF